VRTLTDEYRLCAVHEPPELTKGLDATLDSWIGSARRRSGLLRRLRAEALECETHEKQWRELDSPALAERLARLAADFRLASEVHPAPVVEGLAAVAEVAARTLGLRPRLVQLIGALALHRGYLAEMGTGEGKSLTAALAAVLAGWTGRPCHIVTVNDYLAERDAETFLPLFRGCGLRPGAVTGAMDPEQRRHGHAADVTYTTSKELLADFLRDRLCLGERQTPAKWMIDRLRHSAMPAGEGAVRKTRSGSSCRWIGRCGGIFTTGRR
jgi:preprotein translocase subunit SecA